MSILLVNVEMATTSLRYVSIVFMITYRPTVL